LLRQKTLGLKEAARLLQLTEVVLLRLAQTFKIPTTIEHIPPQKLTTTVRFTPAELRFFAAIRQRILKGQSLSSIRAEVLARAKQQQRKQAASKSEGPFMDASKPLAYQKAIIQMAAASSTTANLATVKTADKAPIKQQGKKRFEQYKETHVRQNSPVFETIASRLQTARSLADNPQINYRERSLSTLFPGQPVKSTHSKKNMPIGMAAITTITNGPKKQVSQPYWLTQDALLKAMPKPVLE